MFEGFVCFYCAFALCLITRVWAAGARCKLIKNAMEFYALRLSTQLLYLLVPSYVFESLAFLFEVQAALTLVKLQSDIQQFIPFSHWLCRMCTAVPCVLPVVYIISSFIISIIIITGDKGRRTIKVWRSCLSSRIRKNLKFCWETPRVCIKQNQCRFIYIQHGYSSTYTSESYLLQLVFSMKVIEE